MACVRKRRWKSNGEAKSAWVVDYCDASGKRRQKSFRLKKEADWYLEKLLHELRCGEHVPDAECITIEEACKLWIRRCKTEQLERSTLEDYAQICRLHIIPAIGRIRLNQLNKVAVETFRDELLSTKTYKRAQRILRYLKIILGTAQTLGKVGTNVAQGVTISDKSREKGSVETLSKIELNAFTDAFENSSPRRSAFGALLSRTAMRASEIRGLAWRSVDLANGFVHVDQRADRWCQIGPPKTQSSRRSIDISPDTAARLAKLRKECGTKQFVFEVRGRPPRYSEVIKQLFDPLMFAADLTRNNNGRLFHRYSLHTFRHTVASVWIEMGISAKRIQCLMGHATIQTTFDLYGHLFDLQYSSSDVMTEIENLLRRGSGEVDPKKSWN